jgi:hypothetical protein
MTGTEQDWHVICVATPEKSTTMNGTQPNVTGCRTLSRKGPWTRPWKSHWRHQSIRRYRLVMTKESSPMMMTLTGNTSNLQCQEVGRRNGSKELVVIWAYSMSLVWLVWFVSKRFCKRNNHDYQASQKSWLSKDLIIKPRSLSDYQMLW